MRSPEPPNGRNAALAVVALVLLAVVIVATRGDQTVHPVAPVLPEPASAFVPPLSIGSLTLERTYTAGDRTHAVVRYHNDSDRTMGRVVSVQCDAIDPGGRVVATGSGSLAADEHGPLLPGFEGTLDIPIPLDGAAAESIACEIEQAR
jgi:hypothetical protein